MKLMKSKHIQAAIAIAAAVLLALVGTFAWNSFTQQRINIFNITVAPGVNLHDDFAGESEKDVYVENSGDNPVLVRVRLVELLRMGETMLPEDAVDDETITNWHWHTPSETDIAVCDFKAHEYFTWTMDGQKFYMPAPDGAKGDNETEPLCVGDLDEVVDYAALLREAFKDNSDVLTYIDEYLNGDASHITELQAAISETVSKVLRSRRIYGKIVS